MERLAGYRRKWIETWGLCPESTTYLLPPIGTFFKPPTDTQGCTLLSPVTRGQQNRSICQLDCAGVELLEVSQPSPTSPLSPGMKEGVWHSTVVGGA